MLNMGAGMLVGVVVRLGIVKRSRLRVFMIVGGVGVRQK